MRSRTVGTIASLLGCFGLAVLAGCSAGVPDATSPSGAWVGTITTEGNVTTVVNESGSVWSGAATLVEEASIGVDVGEEPYMLGRVADVRVNDGRIYVVEFDTPAVRVYDIDGTHLIDIGRSGEGPGEFQAPNSVVVGPDGRIYVKEGRPGGRINVYDADGTSVDTLYGDRLLGSGWPLVVTPDGTLYTPTRDRLDAEPRGIRPGMAVPGPDGVVGEPLAVPMLGYEQVGVRVNERAVLGVPFAPIHRWAMSPRGAFVVGITDDYRFEIHALDGHITVVEKTHEPIPIEADEAEWRRRSTVRDGRRWQEGWNWDGAEIPAFKPAWTGMTVAADGGVWIARRGPSRRVEDCDEDPLAVADGRPRSCWESDLAYEVFDEEGRFLGPVELPDIVVSLSTSYIRGNTVVVAVEDDAGTPMVKRYRLESPSQD